MLFQGLQLAHAGYRHPHNVLCLLRGLLLLTRVNPRAVLPDIRHVEEVLVDPAFPESIPEQGLMGPGVQAPTTTRFSPLSRMVSAICWAASVEHMKRPSSACSTLSRDRA